MLVSLGIHLVLLYVRSCVDTVVRTYRNAVEVEWPDPIQVVGCGSAIIRAINVVCGVAWCAVDGVV